MSNTDDHRWELSESDKGYGPECDDAYEKKFEEWAARDWTDLIERLKNPTFHLSRVFWVGAILFVVGSGPLLTVILLAQLGLTKDPTPNPVGFGIIAFLTFWPSVILMIV